MKRKRISSILFISLLIATLAGCGAGDVTSNGNIGGGAATGTLSWAAPATYTDGSPITNLAGYRIYYGASSGSYTGYINLAGEGSTSIQVTALASAVSSHGTYHIVVTSYDNLGTESDISNEIVISL